MAASRLLPRMTVYFPKYVCINNARLAVVYYIMMLVTMGIAIYQFLKQERFNKKREVGGEVSVTAWKMSRSLTSIEHDFQRDLAERFCTSPAEAEYEYGSIRYTDIRCAGLCTQNTSSACVSPGELFAVEEGAGVFIPTFFRDEDPFGNASNHFVPGAGAARLAFSHRYSVDRTSEELSSSPEDISGTSTDTSQPQARQVLTILLGHEGSEVRRFRPGEVISLTVDELFEATKLREFSDTVSRLSLDAKYTRVDEDIIDDVGDRGVSVRLTGVNLQVQLRYSNRGWCQLAPDYPWISVSGWSGTVSCMSVRAVRSWVSFERTNLLDMGGAARMRRYHGVRVRFRSSGLYEHLDGSALFDGLTTLLIWSKIPLLLIYYFVIMLLGSLSGIYSRVIHQSMTVKAACTGLAARLVGYSSSFLDVLDTGSNGISKARLVERFKLIFKDSEDLDDKEISRLVDFIYQKMIPGQGDEEATSRVAVQDFSAACSSGEPLSLQSLVSIFDLDRPLGLLEKAFNDGTIGGIRAGRFSADERGQPAAAPRESSGEDLRHCSQLESIISRQQRHKAQYRKLQGKMTATLGSVEEALLNDEENVFEVLRQQLHEQGGPEGRPPTKLGSGATYHGEWVGHTRHGYGIETWPDGSTYEGQWEAGKVHGHAIYRQADGAKYDGDWCNGKQHGQGIHVSESGAKYEGQFVHGLKSGRGTIFLVDGSTYVGEVVDNMMHGPGEYEWVDGNSYRGEWVNNLMHGQGLYTFKDGCEYRGQYRDNEKNGSGVFRWPDGKRYEGAYEKNKRSGGGVFFMPDGTKIEGTWRDGKQHGPGTVTAPSGRKHAAKWDTGILVRP